MEHFLSVKKQARYFSEGNVQAKRLLIVFHGYGQLPAYFIRKFEVLFEKWHVVAPEGLHRFYTSGHQGRVGASWMTKEARDSDIADNLAYVEQLLVHLNEHHAYEEIVLLGFSQGGATAARCFYASSLPISKLVLWASVFPPDLNPSQFIQKNSRTGKNWFVVGDQDPFFSQNQQVEAKDYFEGLGFQVKQFVGNHDIDEKTLLDIL